MGYFTYSFQEKEEHKKNTCKLYIDVIIYMALVPKTQHMYPYLIWKEVRGI
jgi:hypothetical protein